jgi:hypothetical protein
MIFNLLENIMSVLFLASNKSQFFISCYTEFTRSCSTRTLLSAVTKRTKQSTHTRSAVLTASGKQQSWHGKWAPSETLHDHKNVCRWSMSADTFTGYWHEAFESLGCSQEFILCRPLKLLVQLNFSYMNCKTHTYMYLNTGMLKGIF